MSHEAFSFSRRAHLGSHMDARYAFSSPFTSTDSYSSQSEDFNSRTARSNMEVQTPGCFGMRSTFSSQSPHDETFQDSLGGAAISTPLQALALSTVVEAASGRASKAPFATSVLRKNNHEAARKVVSSSDSVITVLPSFWTATKPPSSLHRFTVWQNTLSSIRQSNNNKCSNPPDLKPNTKPSPFSLSIFFFSLKCFFALKKIFL